MPYLRPVVVEHNKRQLGLASGGHVSSAFSNFEKSFQGLPRFYYNVFQRYVFCMFFQGCGDGVAPQVRRTVLVINTASCMPSDTPEDGTTIVGQPYLPAFVPFAQCISLHPSSRWFRRGTAGEIIV